MSTIFEFDSFKVCCIKKSFEKETLEIYLSSEGYVSEDEIKPHLWIKHKYGYSVVDIRNDYSSDDEVFFWVSKNYDLLIKHWYHEITDKELLTALY
jgi:hypothetical protein